MAKDDRTEIIEGREFQVTVLPSDPRLQPARTRKRTVWASLSAQEKKAFFASKRAEAKKKRRKRRKRGAG